MRRSQTGSPIGPLGWNFVKTFHIELNEGSLQIDDSSVQENRFIGRTPLFYLSPKKEIITLKANS